MKRGLDLESITDPAECDILVKKLQTLKSQLLYSALQRELERLEELNPDFSQELKSYETSNLSGSIGKFTVGRGNYTFTKRSFGIAE